MVYNRKALLQRDSKRGLILGWLLLALSVAALVVPVSFAALRGFGTHKDGELLDAATTWTAHSAVTTRRAHVPQQDEDVLGVLRANTDSAARNAAVAQRRLLALAFAVPGALLLGMRLGRGTSCASAAGAVLNP
jgi:hypothetical protein